MNFGEGQCMSIHRDTFLMYWLGGLYETMQVKVVSVTQGQTWFIIPALSWTEEAPDKYLFLDLNLRSYLLILYMVLSHGMIAITSTILQQFIFYVVMANKSVGKNTTSTHNEGNYISIFFYLSG